MTKGERRRKYRSTMHLAWLEVVRELEFDNQKMKQIMKKRDNIGRKAQACLAHQREFLTLLYDLRNRAKEMSFKRWEERHTLFPERLPICGEPSKHPEDCSCPRPENRA